MENKFLSKLKKKNLLKRAVALMTTATLATGLFASADFFFPKEDKADAASFDINGSVTVSSQQAKWNSLPAGSVIIDYELGNDLYYTGITNNGVSKVVLDQGLGSATITASQKNTYNYEISNIEGRTDDNALSSWRAYVKTKNSLLFNNSTLATLTTQNEASKAFSKTKSKKFNRTILKDNSKANITSEVLAEMYSNSWNVFGSFSTISLNSNESGSLGYKLLPSAYQSGNKKFFDLWMTITNRTYLYSIEGDDQIETILSFEEPKSIIVNSNMLTTTTPPIYKATVSQWVNTNTIPSYVTNPCSDYTVYSLDSHGTITPYTIASTNIKYYGVMGRTYRVSDSYGNYTGNYYNYFIGEPAIVNPSTTFDLAITTSFDYDLSRKIWYSNQYSNNISLGNSLLPENTSTDYTSERYYFENTSDNTITTNIQDKNISNVVPGTSYKIDCSGLSTSSTSLDGKTQGDVNKYISAIVWDAEGNQMYYGKLGEVDDETETVSIKFPAGFSSTETYTLGLFEETVYSGTNIASCSVPSVSTLNFCPTVDVSAVATKTALYDDTITNKDFFEVTVSKDDGTSETTSNFYFMTTDYYNTISDLTDVEGNIAKLDGVNKVETDFNSDDDSEIDVTIIYYYYSLPIVTSCKLSISQSGEKSEVSSPEDPAGWEKYENNGLVWYYQLDENDNAVNLYTKMDIQEIVKDNTLIIPETIDGHTVISIGGGSKTTPFVPSNYTSSISKVVFPATVTTINDYAFYNTRIEGILTIPSTISSIGYGAFDNARYITSVKLETETNDLVVGQYAFAQCSKLNKFIITAASGTSISFNKYAVAYNPNLVYLTATGQVTFGNYACIGCDALTNIKIDQMSGTIGENAFKNCTALKSLYIPSTIDLKKNAFNSCTKLANLEINTSIVEANVFSNCYNITNLIFGENVQEVNENWGGYATETGTASVGSNRLIYVKNPETIFNFVRDENGNYYSALGFMRGTNSSSADHNYYRTVKLYYNGTSDIPSVVNVSTGAVKSYVQSTFCKIPENYNNAFINEDTKRILDCNNAMEFSQSKDYTLEENSEIKDTVNNTSYIISSEQVGIVASYPATVKIGNKINKSSFTVYAEYNNGTISDNFDTKQFYIVSDKKLTELKASNPDLFDADGDIIVDEATFKEAIGNDTSITAEEQETGNIQKIHVISYNGSQIYTVSVDVEVATETTIYDDAISKYGSIENAIKEADNLTEEVNEFTADIVDKIKEMNKITGADVEVSEDMTSAEVVEAYKETMKNVSEILSTYSNDTKTILDFLTEKLLFDISYEENNETITYDTSKTYTQEQYNKFMAVASRLLTEEAGKDVDDLKALVAEYSDFVASISDILNASKNDNETNQEYLNRLVSIITNLSKKLKGYEGLSEIEALLSISNAEGTDPETRISSVKAKIIAMLEEIDTLNKKIDQLNGMISTGDVNASELLDELNTYKKAYNDLVEKLNNLTKKEDKPEDSKSQDYISKDPESGNTIIYIGKDENGNEKEINAVPKTDENGNTMVIEKEDPETGEKKEHIVYVGTGDFDGDGKEEEKLVYVDDDGVHVVDENGKEIEKIYTATDVELIMRKAAAQLSELQGQLTKMEAQLKTYEETFSSIREVLGLPEDATDEEVIAKVSEIVTLNQKLNSDNITLQEQNATLEVYVEDLKKQLQAANITPATQPPVITMAPTKAPTKAPNSSSEPASPVEPTKVPDIKVTEAPSNPSTGNNTEEVTKLKAQISELQSQNSALKKDVAELTKANNDLATAKSTLETTNTKLTTDNTALTKNNSTLSADKTKLETENKELVTENETLTASNSTLTSQNATLTKKNNTLTSTNKTLKSQNSSLTSKNSTLNSKVSALQKTNSSLTSQVSSLKSQLASANKGGSNGGGNSVPTYTIKPYNPTNPTVAPKKTISPKVTAKPNVTIPPVITEAPEVTFMPEVTEEPVITFPTDTESPNRRGEDEFRGTDDPSETGSPEKSGKSGNGTMKLLYIILAFGAMIAVGVGAKLYFDKKKAAGTGDTEDGDDDIDVEEEDDDEIEDEEEEE